MATLRKLKLEAKSAVEQQQVIRELNGLVADIERSDRTISVLKRELETINSKYKGPRSTREDVAYLTGLLECAKKKLAWEKQIASLQKRTPQLMERIARIMNDPEAAAVPETREQMLRALQAIQSAMEKLESDHATGPESAGQPDQSPSPG